ncbi:MAG: MFS transporter [Deltaproteobacteria bacterium]|nr:MFS transporter [Deltaproteobacteria bacterium]
MEKDPSNKLSLSVKIGYGSAEISGSMIWIIFYLYFMYFLTDVVHLDPGTAGLILAVATLWDAVAGLFVGVMSDQLKSRWGRRRPFLLAVAVPYGIAAWLLFTDFSLGPVMTQIYFFAMVIIYWSCMALLNIPYTALAAEMTQNYDDRMSLVSYRAVAGQVFGIAAASLPLILAAYFGEAFGSMKIGWSLMAAAFGFFSIFPILHTWRATRGYELFPESSAVKIKEMIRALTGNRPFRYTIAIWTTGIIGANLGGAVFIYFMKYRMGFDESKISTAFLVFFVGGFLYIPLINYISAKTEKRWAFIIFSALWMLPMCCGMLWVGPETEIWYWIFLSIMSVGSILVYIMGWSMIPDVVEVDECKSGQRREGVYFAVAAFIQKAGSALALWFVGFVLSRVGYVPDVEQTENVMWCIRLLTGIAPVFFIIAAMIFAYLLPLTREKHQALCEIISCKKDGKAYDLTCVEDILPTK